MLKMLARARSRLGPKLRAHARARSYSGIQCSYSLGVRDFGARPIPTKMAFVITLIFMNWPDVKLQRSWYSEGFSTRITIVFFWSIFMSCFYMILQISWLSEILFTRITFLSKLACLVIIMFMQFQFILLSKDSRAYITMKFFSLLHELFLNVGFWDD